MIKVGGSISIDETGPKFSYFRKFLPVLKQLGKENQIIISIGGGKFVRQYFKNVEKFGLDAEKKEWLGIDLLKVNVKFLSMLLGKNPIYTIDEINEKTEGVIGGIKPGRSTDANAAYAASKIKADYFIKLTDVDGIYTSDPNKNNNAKKLTNISFYDFRKYGIDGKPGSYGIMDQLAIDIITKNRIKTVVMNGKNPRNILKVLKGQKLGTLIS